LCEFVELPWNHLLLVRLRVDAHDARMKGWLLRILLGVLFLGLAAQAQEHNAKIVVIAHRGNHESAHENTLEAIRNAIAIKADFVELDIRRTKDGRHILMHDRTVKRMTGVDAKVNDLTLREMQALKISDGTRPAIPASRVPTFEEALNEIGSSVGLYLDFKDGDPEFLAAELRKRNQLKTTVVYLGIDEIPAWRKAEPSMKFIVSIPGKNLTAEKLNSFLAEYPGIVLDGPVTDYTKELVEIAHSRGNVVWPDIQNPGENANQWLKALELGVDGLQTDHPAQLIAYLFKLGRH